MKTCEKIVELNGYPLVENWYTSCLINTPEQNAEALRLSWGAATRNRGATCTRCQGKGYTRKDGNIGCQTCGGLGVTK